MRGGRYRIREFLEFGGPKESPTTGSNWAKYTIKGEINETKPTILHYIYLH